MRVKQTRGSKLEESSKLSKNQNITEMAVGIQALHYYAAASLQEIWLHLKKTSSYLYPDTDPDKTFLYNRVNYKASKLASSPLQQTCTVDIPN